jgi:two-component system, chemotaxis family, protein-glutamate methylesterase/glutaminase
METRNATATVEAPVRPKGRRAPFATPGCVVAIGSSTGGPEALEVVLSSLPKDLDAGVVIVQHMPGGFTARFAQRLSKISAMPVKEVEEGDIVEVGKILLAKGDYHLTFEPVRDRYGKMRARALLNQDPPMLKLRPTVDNMMTTLAPIFGTGLIGVILTGMGEDGAIGMEAIKRNGGRTVVQNEESSTVYGMAQEVVKRKLADHEVPLESMARMIERLTETK